MAIAPGRDGDQRAVDGAPPELRAGGRQSVAEWVRSPSWTPGPDGRLVESAEAERNSIRIKLRESGLASPSGEWVAGVARHIYGPEDVLILTKERSSS